MGSPLSSLLKLYLLHFLEMVIFSHLSKARTADLCRHAPKFLSQVCGLEPIQWNELQQGQCSILVQKDTHTPDDWVIESLPESVSTMCIHCAHRQVWVSPALISSRSLSILQGLSQPLASCWKVSVLHFLRLQVWWGLCWDSTTPVCGASSALGLQLQKLCVQSPGEEELSDFVNNSRALKIAKRKVWSTLILNLTYCGCKGLWQCWG